MLLGQAAWPAQQEVKLVATSREVPERGRLAEARMVQGKGGNSFLVPAGWRMGLEPKSGVVVLQSAEYAGSIEVRRLLMPEKSADISQFWQQVSAQAGYREVKEDYAWAGVPYRSHIFDMVETAEGNLKVHRRLCFMLMEDHVLLVVLTAREEGFSACLRAFEIVLASLRTE